MKNNKGFSLVELIIVIAIMAILVGVMAPQLIKYIEKSNVSADQQMLDTVYQALRYAIVETEVQEDDESRTLIDTWTADKKAISLSEIGNHPNSVLFKEMINTLGWTDMTAAYYRTLLRSSHDSSSADILFYCDGFNIRGMWITTSDKRGKKDKSESAGSLEAVENNISVPAKLNDK